MNQKTPAPPSGPQQAPAQPGRTERLAAALRENLKRRKAQGRARREAPGGAEAGQPGKNGGL